jgi:geranylgeranyl diphosphate synthase type I
MLPAVEVELRRNVETAGQAELAGLRQMLAYHMGWEGEGAGPEASGKRIRPLLVLLCCAAAGGDWTHALPAAAAVELVHNFSLIHDDIQDNSDRRRGRLTVWKLWGVPQAINSGDTMFTLAHLAVLRLAETAAPEVVLQAAQWLQETCLHLTQGQYLDISYEHRHDLALTDYWPMVEGKTAALLSTCTRLGALVAGAAPARLEAYRQFGRWLGLAFQAQDDLLGIWGDADLTGKSAASDLLTGKKSLPVLYGLGLRGAFANRWAQGPIAAAEVPALAAQLAEEGGRAYTQEAADRLTNDALQALAQAGPTGEAGVALTSLAKKLLNRNV